HRDNPAEGKEFLYKLAAKHELIVTGSSDYHGTGKPNGLGENLPSPNSLARIEALATGTTVVR
ncbi:phosphatase, partial [Vibrio vulnificus]